MVREARDRPAGWRLVPYEGKAHFKKVRIRREAEIQEVLEKVHAHEYVVVLGPPFNEKTRFLQDIAGELAQSPGRRPVYVNLRQVRSDTEAEFYASLARTIERDLDPSGALHASSVHPLAIGRDFQRFLEERVAALQAHLVLLIDHHQVLPQDLLKSLLRSLRSLYMERDILTPWRVSVIMAGQADMDALSRGATSPFNMAKRVMLPPLTLEQSRDLIEATLEAYGLPFTQNAVQDILHWVQGDCYLIPHLCHLCNEVVAGYRRNQVTSTVVRQAVKRLPTLDSALWPIRETLNVVEEDPDTLLDVVDLLEAGELSRNRSRQQPSRSGADRLQLSGLVTFDGTIYRIKNAFYRQQFRQWLTPSRVGHILRMNGRWREAIAYLAPQLQDPPAEPSAALQVRSDLLEAIVQSIYAAESEQEAYNALMRGIEAGFGLHHVAIYRADVARGELHLVEARGHEQEACQTCIDLRQGDLVEVQAFLDNGHALRRGDQSQRLVAPLTPERRPIGLVTVDDYAAPVDGRGAPEGLQELLRFLRHAAGAIEHVAAQTAIQEIGRAVLGAGDGQGHLRRVLQAVCRGLGSDVACLYLVDEDADTLEMTASIGSLNRHHSILARIPLSEEHPAAICLHRARKGEITGWPVIRASEGMEMNVHLPLRAREEVLGVLSLYFAWNRRPSRVNAEYHRLLETFADQVAIAVYNQQLLGRTSEELQKRVAELEEARRELETKREKELSDVAWAVSHRLSGVIMSLNDSLSLLQAPTEHLTDDAQAALERLQQQLVSLTGLLKSFKAITRLEDVPFERLEIQKVIDFAIAQTPQCDKVALSVDQLDTPVWISGNHALLCDAFRSLIENACEAMEGRGRLAIRIIPNHEARQVQIRVVDTGPGIPAHLLKRIFDPGFTTKSATERRNQGIGLFTCRTIVHKHQGDIRVLSEAGHGATFVVTLPLIA